MFGVLLITGGQTHQENYARAFAADPRCRLVGLADEEGVGARRAELNRALADALGIPLLDDLQRALERDDVQIVSICAETERRGRISLRAIEAGKHVYLDKEPAATVEEARQISSAARAKGVFTQTFTMLGHPLARKLHAVVAEGRLGPLRALHAQMLFAKGDPGTADGPQMRRERRDPPTQFTFFDAKRELLCVGWYPLALFQSLLGKPRAIQAVTANAFFAAHRERDVEDFAALLLEYAGGVQATVVAGRSGWESHPAQGLHEVVAIGRDGAACLDAYGPRVEVMGLPWHSPSPPHPEDPMGFWSSTQAAAGVQPKQAWWPLEGGGPSDASQFVDCLREGREPVAHAAFAADLLETIFEAYRAASPGAA